MRKKSLIILTLISLLQLSCDQKQQSIDEKVNADDLEVGSTLKATHELAHTTELSQKDSVHVSYSESGDLLEKEFYYKDGSRKIIVYDKKGKKSESDFFSDGKKRFRKFNTKGEVALEHLKKDGKVLLDTIYWDHMELE